jgi:predicted glycosyltransferase
LGKAAGQKEINTYLMKILVDIGHPAHVHLFRNLAAEMTVKGHSFMFTVREGENESQLLKAYGLNFVTIGRKKKGSVRKVLGIPFFTRKILKTARRFKPDLYLSHGSMYAGYAAFLTGKKHLALEDTGNMEQLIFSKPVSHIILSPKSLRVDLGKKHIKYNGFHELAYLHPSRFSPDPAVRNELGIGKDEKFILFRFISWNASHDIGQTGFSPSDKAGIVKEISKLGRVFISSENELPRELQEFKLILPPHHLHHLLAEASLYIGEGATTASECAMLGTPSIYISSLSPDTIENQQKYGLVFCIKDVPGLLEKAASILTTPGVREEFRKKRDLMLNENIDLTSLLIWFIENYPESKTILKSDPDYQFRFR